MFKTAVQNRIFQDVVDQIQDAILDGRLQAGDVLPPERELKEMFGTSRGTLREALRVLEQKGLIKIRVGVAGGSIVRSVNTDQISESLALLVQSQQVSLEQLAEFREGIEGIVAFKATVRASRADLERLHEILQEAKACIGRRDRDAFLHADKMFHMALAQITGNPIFKTLVHSVHENIHRYYDAFLSMEAPELDENYQDLRNLLEAMEKGRPEESEKIAARHVQRFNAYMLEKKTSRQRSKSQLKERSNHVRA